MADLWISFCLLNFSVLVIRLKKIPLGLALLRKVSNSLFLSIIVVLLFNFVVCCRFSPRRRSLYCRSFLVAFCGFDQLLVLLLTNEDSFVCLCAGIDQCTILKSIFVREFFWLYSWTVENFISIYFVSLKSTSEYMLEERIHMRCDYLPNAINNWWNLY